MKVCPANNLKTEYFRFFLLLKNGKKAKDLAKTYRPKANNNKELIIFQPVQMKHGTDSTFWPEKGEVQL